MDSFWIFSSSVWSQIWISVLVDNHQPKYPTNLKKKNLYVELEIEHCQGFGNVVESIKYDLLSTKYILP
jgi:hypothetical protein